MANPRLRLVLLWALVSLGLAAGIYPAARAVTYAAIEARVLEHLDRTLDPALFSSIGGRTNDRRGLEQTGQRINDDLAGFVRSPWYAPLRACLVSLRELDGVVIDDAPSQVERHAIIHRNQIERPITLGISCADNDTAAVLLALLLAGLFAAIAILLPRPLSAAHRQWLQRLEKSGYDSDEALATVGRFSAAELDLNAVQRACAERLLATHPDAAERVLEVATDPRLGALSGIDLHWLLLGLDDDLDNLDEALDLARQPDAVVIDLRAMTLTARGMPVPVSKTPLFYYAWYAMQRLGSAGEGWVANPASNRPDMAVGAELAALMERHGGHGRAINDLAQHGLKARTLDQNRSKIKEEIVACLGEKAAEPYLFQASRDPEGLQMRYRLALDPARIRLET